MSLITLEQLVSEFADGLFAADAKGPVCSSDRAAYKPGIGPFPEARAIQLPFNELVRSNPERFRAAAPRSYSGTRSKCDLVIPDEWALEFKLVRPFGDNGKPAEHWIENILYPYSGNVSALGDCMKLLKSDFSERKAIVVFGYEHTPAQVELETAVRCFELIAGSVLNIRLSQRVQADRGGLVHPYHQLVRCFGWQIYA